MQTVHITRTLGNASTHRDPGGGGGWEFFSFGEKGEGEKGPLGLEKPTTCREIKVDPTNLSFSTAVNRA